MSNRYFCYFHGYMGCVIQALLFESGLTCVQGFGATQGVFREYYFNNPPFKGNQLVASIGLLVVVGTTPLDPPTLYAGIR
jgi:hypothetical protein